MDINLGFVSIVAKGFIRKETTRITDLRTQEKRRTSVTFVIKLFIR